MSLFIGVFHKEYCLYGDFHAWIHTHTVFDSKYLLWGSKALKVRGLLYSCSNFSHDCNMGFFALINVCRADYHTLPTHIRNFCCELNREWKGLVFFFFFCETIIFNLLIFVIFFLKLVIRLYSSLILFLWYKKSKLNALWLSHGAWLLAYVIGALNYHINTAAVSQSGSFEKHADWWVGVFGALNLRALLWAAIDNCSDFYKSLSNCKTGAGLG